MATRETSDDCPGEAHLKSMESVGDTLNLTIHFDANCCPGFVESVSLRIAFSI
jgi:hypothetical protein